MVYENMIAHGLLITLPNKNDSTYLLKYKFKISLGRFRARTFAGS